MSRVDTQNMRPLKSGAKRMAASNHPEQAKGDVSGVAAAAGAKAPAAIDPGAIAAQREHVAQLLLAVPYPPTSNHNTTVVRGRRILSPKYRDWRKKAEAAINDQSDGLGVLAPYRIQYIVERPDNRRRDVENIPKSVSDALQAAGVIRDDAECQHSTVRWANHPPHKGARVWVTIEVAGEAA